MGKIESGAFSSISGKVGNLVGSTWKNINYLKAKPKKSSKPATQQQVEQRLRFRIVSKFLSLLNPFWCVWSRTNDEVQDVVMM